MPPSQNVTSLEALLEVLRNYPEVYLFVGWGSVAQYADVEEVLADLQPFLRDIQQRCGGRRWLILYGGDPAREEAPDIGWLVKRLHDTYSVDLFAVQAAGEPDPHTAYHYRCEPEYGTDGRQLYGGIVEGRLVAAAKVYLADQLTQLQEGGPAAGRRLLTGCFATGGGNLAVQELQYADQRGLPWTYVPARARNTAVCGEYGPVHPWAAGRLAGGARPRVAAVAWDAVQQRRGGCRRWGPVQLLLMPAVGIGCVLGAVGVRLLTKRVR